MAHVTYRIVEHDGGWAYKLGDSFSETFASMLRWGAAQPPAKLAEARAEIAADKDIPEETRRQILKELDRSIARWKEKEG
mgnify:CR=1 FL=1